jgi:hypothetical protein
MSYAAAFLYLGLIVFAVGVIVLTVRLMSKKTAETKLVNPIELMESAAA